MRRRPPSGRRLGFGLALVLLLSGCRSTPETYPSRPPDSSLLAVDVLFPVDLGRDPSLVEAFLVRGPLRVGMERIPELIPASFVKRSRAYLLDPEPGTYSLVAVSSAVAAPLRDQPVAEGVVQTTLSGTIANAVVLPFELIERTRTTVGPGEVVFMGALRIAEGDRINAKLPFDDDFQMRVAERVRPGASSASGLSAWFTLAWTADLEKTSFRNEPADREAFRDAALEDLGASPWAQVVARAAPPPVAPARVAAAEPAALPARPERRRVPGIPAESPLAQIEIGMDWKEVRRILGDPDGRLDRSTAKAWIPFYTGPGAYLRDWIYEGQGRVVFSRHGGSLEVLDVVPDPTQNRRREE